MRRREERLQADRRVAVAIRHFRRLRRKALDSRFVSEVRNRRRVWRTTLPAFQECLRWPISRVYDHVRTPRGKGRPDGALLKSPDQLATQTTAQIRDRSQLDTRLIDDVIFGTLAAPFGKQGSNLKAATGNGESPTPRRGSCRACRLNRFYAPPAWKPVNLASSRQASGPASSTPPCPARSSNRCRACRWSSTAPGSPITDRWLKKPATPYKVFLDRPSSPPSTATTAAISMPTRVQSQERAAAAWDQGYFPANPCSACATYIGEVLLDR